MVDVAAGILVDREPGSGLNRIARFAGRLVSLGLVGTAHLAWRAGAAALGVAGAAALITSLPQMLSEPDFAVSNAQASVTAPAATSAAALASADIHLRWQPVVSPIAVFGLESPELEKLPFSYAARRAASGSERDDTLRFGRFGDGAAHLHVSARRTGTVAETMSRFFVDVAREAARHDLGLDRASAAVGMPTKFGVVETADATLSGPGGQRACLAFRHVSALQPLRLSGWWCGTADRPADRGQLACLIDRFDLLSAGEDRPLRQLFAQAELNRNAGCSVSRLAVSGRKASWLDPDGHAPALKTGGGSAKTEAGPDRKRKSAR